LGIVAISSRNEGIRARAEASHYHEALAALHEDHVAVLTHSLIKEREDLRHEYLTTLEIATKQGILIAGANE
jgi:hypothetical protein